MAEEISEVITKRMSRKKEVEEEEVVELRVAAVEVAFSRISRIFETILRSNGHSLPHNHNNRQNRSCLTPISATRQCRCCFAGQMDCCRSSVPMSCVR